MSWEIGFQLPSTSPCRCVRLQCIHRYTVLYRYINMAWKIRLILKGCSMWPRVPALHTQVYSLIRQSDRMKTSSKRMQTAVSPVHQVWPKPFCKAQRKVEGDKAHRGRDWRTTSGNEQVWSSASPRGQWRTGKNGENWLQNHLWCPTIMMMMSYTKESTPQVLQVVN